MTVSAYLNLVKYIYAVGQKMARNDCNMVKRKSCAFHFESESTRENFTLILSEFQSSEKIFSKRTIFWWYEIWHT